MLKRAGICVLRLTFVVMLPLTFCRLLGDAELTLAAVAGFGVVVIAADVVVVAVSAAPFERRMRCAKCCSPAALKPPSKAVAAASASSMTSLCTRFIIVGLPKPPRYTKSSNVHSRGRTTSVNNNNAIEFKYIIRAILD